MTRKTTKTNTTPTTVDAAQVQQIDPTTLLVDANIRHDVRLDKTFLASIKAHGVLVPIVAVATESGVRVRYGHRRTAAAVQVALPTVPVVVAADEATDDQGTIERIVAQWAENEHRAGLTNAERVAATEQLALLGLSATKIARQTHTKKADVDAALSVAGSDLAKAATVRYDWLTLDQAAAVAEFEDDTEAVKTLVAAAKNGRFDHTVQRMRDDRTEAAQRAEQTAALQAEGLRVIDCPTYGDDPEPLEELRSADGENGDVLDAREHREHCPGHVAWIGSAWQTVHAETGVALSDEDDEEAWDNATNARVPVVVHGCEDPKKHGHVDRYSYPTIGGRTPVADMSPTEREEAKAARSLVIENNKAWASAETVRREWIAQQFATRKTAPAGAATFIAASLVLDGFFLTDVEGNHVATGWLGGDASGYGHHHHALTLLDNATDKRALMVALVLALGAHEAHLHKGSWRSDGTEASGAAHGRYLRFLAANGYTLAEVEEYAISDQTV